MSKTFNDVVVLNLSESHQFLWSNKHSFKHTTSDETFEGFLVHVIRYGMNIEFLLPIIEAL